MILFICEGNILKKISGVKHWAYPNFGFGLGLDVFKFRLSFRFVFHFLEWLTFCFTLVVLRLMFWLLPELRLNKQLT